MSDPKRPFDPRLPRRSFVQGAVSLPVVATVGLGATGCAANVPSQTIAYGDDVDSVPQGRPVRVQDLDVFLLRNDQGVAAISGECPHRGCGVDPKEGGEGYECPCHGSAFENDGTRLSGPADQDLDWLAVRFDDGGELVIDPSTTVPKGTFTPIP
jgi:Rieske Fe-S protein